MKPLRSSPSPAVLPAISVVIAAHNAESFLHACIDSVLRQRDVAIELIVSDDGSTDRTPLIAARYGSAVRYLRHGKASGASTPRNLGAQVAANEFITFFDADDVMLPGKLSAQARALSAYPFAGCAVVDYRNFDHGEGALQRSHFTSCPQLQQVLRRAGAGHSVELPGRTVRELLIEENFSLTSALLFRKTFFEALGGFDESLTGSEDFDLLYRAALHRPVAVVANVGFHRRLHDANTSWRSVQILSQQVLSRCKLAAIETDPDLRRRLDRSSREFRVALVEQLGRHGQTMAALRALRGAYPALASIDGMRALAWALAGPAVRWSRGQSPRAGID